ncbi:endo-1,4-beta-xylanase [Paraburkholderia sp.]|uniref:endo-1,4-beta-xylanase n=1 Tax=Paraburkholderia sp. TaxID=1926495 RepID=UPI0039E2CB66
MSRLERERDDLRGDAVLETAEVVRPAANHHDDGRRTAPATTITFWGYSDKHTWLTSTPVPRTNLPLLFDANLKPKATLWTIVDSSYRP